jgi:hypothetical protein
MQTQRLELPMIPALSPDPNIATMGQLVTVPALRIRIGQGSDTVTVPGIIDTAAELCIIDTRIAKQLKHSEPIGSMAVATLDGFVRDLRMYALQFDILSPSGESVISFSNVPVAVMALQNKASALIGRRGVLEKLTLELDFPHGRIKITVPGIPNKKYPFLAQHFASLPLALQAFESGRAAEGTMALAWEMERFVDRLLMERAPRTQSAAKRLAKESLLQKLQIICSAASPNQAIKNFVDARNMAAHGGSVHLRSQPILEAAEAIVQTLIQSSRRRSMASHRERVSGYGLLKREGNNF